LHSRHCQSKHIGPAATAGAWYGQWGAGCMISAHAEPGMVQVAGGIKAAARCGKGRCPNRRWPEHAHWPWGCCHVLKARVPCCKAATKWAVSGRDRQAQRSNHGSDCSWLALQCKQLMGGLGQRHRHREAITAVIAAGWRAQLLPPTPSLPFLSLIYIPHSSQILLSFVFSLFAHLRMWPSCKGHLRE